MRGWQCPFYRYRVHGRAAIAALALPSEDCDGMLDRDDVRPSDSCKADRNSQVNRSVSFVICCRWIVNSSRGRQNGDQKYSEDNDRPTQVLHGKNPKIPQTICR